MLGTYRVTILFKLNEVLGARVWRFRWLGWQLSFLKWQREGGAPGPAGRASVDGVEGARGRRRRLLLLAVVDGLVVAQAVQTRVDPPANVTHGLPGRSHVHVLDVSFEPRQGRQALVTRLTAVLFLGGAGATWSQVKQLAPSTLAFNALSYRSLCLSTATPHTTTGDPAAGCKRD